MTNPLESLRQHWRAPGLVPGYELLNILGAGGQGLVFKARKTAIGRMYVVKFLRPPDPADPVLWRTAELDHLAVLAELRHPNLVAIEDKGEALGLVYLVFEFAGDRTLKTWMRDPAADLAAGIAYLDQAAQGLAYLHDRGVLHLDVKPSNIFLHEARARLGDFGLAHPSSISGPVDLGLASGTPPYAAPEVVERSQASPASDVFSLARTLDDVVIAAVSRTDAAPPAALVDLVNDATSFDPRARPTLPAFRARLAAAPRRGLRPVTFRPVPLGSGDSPRPVRFHSV